MKKPNNILTADDDNVSMHESSLSSKISGSEKDNNDVATAADDLPQEKNRMEEEEINFEDTHFQIPPLSINQLMRKQFKMTTGHMFFGHPCNFQSPRTLVSPMAVVYNALKEFMVQLPEEDPNFGIFRQPQQI